KSPARTPDHSSANSTASSPAAPSTPAPPSVSPRYPPPSPPPAPASSTPPAYPHEMARAEKIACILKQKNVTNQESHRKRRPRQCHIMHPVNHVQSRRPLRHPTRQSRRRGVARMRRRQNKLLHRRQPAFPFVSKSLRRRRLKKSLARNAHHHRAA